MRKFLLYLLLILLYACGNQSNSSDEKIITVSIGPFRYFVEAIAGEDFNVNVMVPPGSNPHIYEPFPEQVSNLRKSIAYISNGFLGFEMTWLDRFYEMNTNMKKLSVGDKIESLENEHHHEGEHIESVDPHYWVSPKCARIIALSVKDLLVDINPVEKEKYDSGYIELLTRIDELDRAAEEAFSSMKGEQFMIYHPNLGYLARDYGITEVSVEYEGKEPSASRMKYLIDLARARSIKTIFVQREYDSKNARAIASEIGAEVVTIDPLSEDWYTATLNIIGALESSFLKETKN
jgi:zinc transport system substrate-binding protein